MNDQTTRKNLYINVLRSELDTARNTVFYVEPTNYRLQKENSSVFLWHSQKWEVKHVNEDKIPKMRPRSPGHKRFFRRKKYSIPERDETLFEVEENLISCGNIFLFDITWISLTENVNEIYLQVFSEEIIQHFRKPSTSYTPIFKNDDFDKTYESEFDSSINQSLEHSAGVLAKLTYRLEKILLVSEHSENNLYNFNDVYIKLSFEPAVISTDYYTNVHGLSTSHFQVSEKLGQSCEHHILQVTTRGGSYSDFSLSLSEISLIKKLYRKCKTQAVERYNDLPEDVLVIDCLDEVEGKDKNFLDEISNGKNSETTNFDDDFEDIDWNESSRILENKENTTIDKKVPIQTRQVNVNISEVETKVSLLKIASEAIKPIEGTSEIILDHNTQQSNFSSTKRYIKKSKDEKGFKHFVKSVQKSKTNDFKHLNIEESIAEMINGQRNDLQKSKVISSSVVMPCRPIQAQTYKKYMTAKQNQKNPHKQAGNLIVEPEINILHRNNDFQNGDFDFLLVAECYDNLSSKNKLLVSQQKQTCKLLSFTSVNEPSKNVDPLNSIEENVHTILSLPIDEKTFSKLQNEKMIEDDILTSESDLDNINSSSPNHPKLHQNDILFADDINFAKSDTKFKKNESQIYLVHSGDFFANKISSNKDKVLETESILNADVNVLKNEIIFKNENNIDAVLERKPEFDVSAFQKQSKVLNEKHFDSLAISMSKFMVKNTPTVCVNITELDVISPPTFYLKNKSNLIAENSPKFFIESIHVMPVNTFEVQAERKNILTLNKKCMNKFFVKEDIHGQDQKVFKMDVKIFDLLDEKKLCINSSGQSESKLTIKTRYKLEGALDNKVVHSVNDTSNNECSLLNVTNSVTSMQLESCTSFKNNELSLKKVTYSLIDDDEANNDKPTKNEMCLHKDKPNVKLSPKKYSDENQLNEHEILRDTPSHSRFHLGFSIKSFHKNNDREYISDNYVSRPLTKKKPISQQNSYFIKLKPPSDINKECEIKMAETEKSFDEVKTKKKSLKSKVKKIILKFKISSKSKDEETMNSEDLSDRPSFHNEVTTPEHQDIFTKKNLILNRFSKNVEGDKKHLSKRCNSLDSYLNEDSDNFLSSSTEINSRKKKLAHYASRVVKSKDYSPEVVARDTELELESVRRQRQKSLSNSQNLNASYFENSESFHTERQVGKIAVPEVFLNIQKFNPARSVSVGKLSIPPAFSLEGLEQLGSIVVTDELEF